MIKTDSHFEKVKATMLVKNDIDKNGGIPFFMLLVCELRMQKTTESSHLQQTPWLKSVLQSESEGN